MKRKRKNRRAQRHAERKGKTKARPLSEKPKSEVYNHPVYGEIPLVVRTVTMQSGETREYMGLDPEFRPPLPSGAVRANIQAQSPCYGLPRFYYLDESQNCYDCKECFVFSAEEKKFWYETLQFTMDSHAVRCVQCRRRQRRIKGLQRELSRVLAILKRDPKNAYELVALAEATFTHWELTRTGKLERAVAAARKASRLLPDKKKKIALQWEGKLQKARYATGQLEAS